MPATQSPLLLVPQNFLAYRLSDSVTQFAMK
jgi:hypothetical protein